MTNVREYEECVRCVMDTSDPEIEFDKDGVCNHCKKFDQVTSKNWFPNHAGKQMLEARIDQIKKEGRGKDYDCIIGLSGGVDSSYLAVKLKEYALRPLVVHVDAGWNSELAVHNIEQVVKYCDFDLHTHVMDWEEVRDLQVAYLKAGVANQDVVQDHAFFSSLYHFAVKNKIKTVISGGNIATEGVFPSSWHHAAMDATNLHAIHKRFGKRKLKQYKTISFFQYYIFYPYMYKMKTLRPLNLMAYNKVAALIELEDTVGYKPYGRKHGESRFTKFFQNHYLPNKFGMDKRRPHLSSEILSGLKTRAEVVEELNMPLYDAAELLDDQAYIAKKLGFSLEEFNQLCEPPGTSYNEFANWDKRYKRLKSLQGFMQSLTGKRVGNYGY